MAERIRPLSGFPELLPGPRLVEQRILDQLRATFELHGFSSIETRSVEPLDQLLRKGETDKEVYVLRRLQAGDDDDGAAASSVGLHFDLTVPFARFVLENAGKLDFPFRRYQIQKAWRGERPQEGRYREFTQADIDIVGRDVLPFHHDVEVARVMAEALSGLPTPPLRLQINSRRLMEGFFRGVGAEDIAAVMRTVDKIDKLPPARIAELLTSDAGLSEQQASACLALADIRSEDTSFVDRVRALGVNNELLDQGLDELADVVDGARRVSSDRITVVADLRIARGLDYYTGTVFETRMAGYESIGSICSGGRYDSLASDGRTTFPGVGISLGVSRMLVPLLARGAMTSTRSVPSAVLVALADESTRAASDAVATALRARGIACEVAPSAQKYGKQIRFAERRGIPYVWFPGADDAAGKSGVSTDGSAAGHEVKDIRSGDQFSADPGDWRPPADDLRPRIVPGSGHEEGDT